MDRVNNAVNQPKGTKNESNSQLFRKKSVIALAVNQPKGTKNESNSQLECKYRYQAESCKSTQRYKERKQFTTRTVPGLLYFPDLG